MIQIFYTMIHYTCTITSLSLYTVSTFSVIAVTSAMVTMMMNLMTASVYLISGIYSQSLI